MARGYRPYRGSRRHNRSHAHRNNRILTALVMMYFCIVIAAIIVGVILRIMKHRFPLLPCVLIAVIVIFTFCLNRKLGYDFYTFQALRVIGMAACFLVLLLCLLCIRYPILERIVFWPMALD